MGTKKKTEKDFEVFIKGIIDKYIPILMLQRHTIEVKFGTASPNAWFDFIYNYPYLNQTIRYSEQSFQTWLENKKNLEPYILHELCHCLTDPLYAKATDRYIGKNEIEDERERLTDYICNIVYALTKVKT